MKFEAIFFSNKIIVTHVTQGLPSSFFSRPVRMGWRGGRQNACVWQTWRGYYLHVVIFTKCQCFLIFFKKICLKEDQVWGNFFFKQNYCHDCHISFTVFFVASHADVLRGSSRVPTSDEPLRGNLVCSPVLLCKFTFREFTQQDGRARKTANLVWHAWQ